MKIETKAGIAMTDVDVESTDTEVIFRIGQTGDGEWQITLTLTLEDLQTIYERLDKARLSSELNNSWEQYKSRFGKS